jgi:hypothetical protein
MPRYPLGLLALALLACETPTAPSNALEASVQLSRATVTQADTLSIIVTLRNTSAYPLTIHNASGCLVSFLVEAPSEGLIGFDNRRCPLVVHDLTIPAFATSQATLPWDLVTTAGPLGPGHYEVVGGATAAGPGTLQLRSDPSPLTVLP